MAVAVLVRHGVFRDATGAVTPLQTHVVGFWCTWCRRFHFSNCVVCLVPSGPFQVSTAPLNSPIESLSFEELMESVTLFRAQRELR